MRRTVLVAAVVSLCVLPLAGCSTSGETAPPTPSGSLASGGAEPSGPTPVAVGEVFAWPDGLEATATVLGRLRPADRTDLEAGVVDEARLTRAREGLPGGRSEPMGLRVELTNTGDAPVDLDEVELQWVGVKVGGMARKVDDDGALTGELAPGRSVTEESAWAVPDMVAVGYQVLVWPQGPRKGAAGQFSGTVPGASIRPPQDGHHDGSGHAGH
ncbi:hypothetical protein F0L17_01320 [Streptomyces sp. TRM43335]|uniref:Lipoprotein n=1 Tax=Streptomyces taklimakanensis TaxID=2569853 RepID=A0A6G2B6E4_9ACTN|nr:hypothetical protein [Streptomyces taklimakanensis]MTE17794.1 hypothetical protein [Streptomyces taklimakanensis]